MNIKIQIIIGIIVILALCIIVNMIRKKRLELRYALSWLCVGIAILVLDCFPQLIAWLSEKIGIASPVNMLFFFGFCLRRSRRRGLRGTCPPYNLCKLSVSRKFIPVPLSFYL